MGANVVLGVDIGTTSAKAVAFDVDGRDLGRGETPYPLLEPEPGQAVQDPGAMVDATLAAIRTAAAAARDHGARTVALSFSGAMHSLVGLDADGNALTPLITWADMRATEQAERLRREHPELHDRTGHAAASDGAADQARVVRRERARDLRRRAALGGDQGARDRAHHRRVGRRPLDRIGHGSAEPDGARLGQRGARHRGRRRASGCRRSSRPRSASRSARRRPPNSGSRRICR